MISFGSDYIYGAHPRVLEMLARHNRESYPGYGEDRWCRAAEERLRRLIDLPQAALHFVAGGTQANLTLIAALLRPHQGVVAADSGHISVHETGAIEATGHKVLCLPHDEGKLRAEDLERLVRDHRADSSFEHMVQPGMVYLSQSTEFGSVYSRAELAAIRAVCRRYGLLTYIDGARLGYALAGAEDGLTMSELARLCDAFSIGMTKQGALFGEGLVICEPALQKDFRYLIKQRGGMLAKGWLLGLQFEALFEDDLYFKLSQHAVALALRLRAGMEALGISFYVSSPTNQQFPILPTSALEQLGRDFVWSPIASLPDGQEVLRFCTSWASTEAEVDQLLTGLDAALAGRLLPHHAGLGDSRRA